MNINHNIIICNHYSKITKPISNFLEYGSVIAARKLSVINIYDGEISNNIQEMNITKNTEEGVLPEVMNTSYYFETRGTVVYLVNSTLNIFGGKICNNKAINNSDINSNQNSTIGGYSINQRCMGAVAFCENSSDVNLFK